jgi:hypothetical protein
MWKAIQTYGSAAFWAGAGILLATVAVTAGRAIINQVRK